MPERSIDADPVQNRRERLWRGAVVRLASIASVNDQARLLQNPQVLRHRRLCHARTVGQCMYGLFAFAGQVLEDRPTGRVGKGLEHAVTNCLHSEIIAICLLVCQFEAEARAR